VEALGKVRANCLETGVLVGVGDGGALQTMDLVQVRLQIALLMLHLNVFWSHDLLGYGAHVQLLTDVHLGIQKVQSYFFLLCLSPLPSCIS